MSEKIFGLQGFVKIVAGKIVSVEKGNIEKIEVPVESRVCAFTMRVDGVSLPVKVILKGKSAIAIYQNELKYGRTIWTEDSGTIVNIDAEIREVREKEFVVHNPTCIDFFVVKSYKV